MGKILQSGNSTTDYVTRIHDNKINCRTREEEAWYFHGEGSGRFEAIVQNNLPRVWIYGSQNANTCDPANETGFNSQWRNSGVGDGGTRTGWFGDGTKNFAAGA